MKATEFQVLIGQFGELSEAQRSALLKALSGRQERGCGDPPDRDAV